MTGASIATDTAQIALTARGESYCRQHQDKERLKARAALRKEAEAEIEKLIAFVDELDGDPDLEEGGDDEPTTDEEPSLGWTATNKQVGDQWTGRSPHHWDVDVELDDADAEESDPGEDNGDRELDPAELGIADSGGMQEQCGTLGIFGFDGEGNRVADEMLDAVRYGGSRHIDPRAVHQSPRHGVIVQEMTKPALEQITLPPVYAMICRGDCLHPKILDGSKLEFSTTDLPRPGDYVAVWLDPSRVKPGEPQSIVKRLVIDLRRGDLVMLGGERGVIVEMLNPPRQFNIPESAIRGVHKMTRVVPEGEVTRKLTGAERMAAGLPLPASPAGG